MDRAPHVLSWHCLLLPSCPIIAFWKISNVFALTAEGACGKLIDVELPLRSPKCSLMLLLAA